MMRWLGSSGSQKPVSQLLDVGDRATLVAQVEPMLALLPEDARRLWARVAGPR